MGFLWILSPQFYCFLFYYILFVVLTGNVGFIFLISLVVFIFYNVCKNYFSFVYFFLFILYGCFINFGGLSFQIKCSFFAFFFFLQFCCLSHFLMFFLGICNFWQPYFYFFILLGFFFLLFWFFKYVTGSIVLVRFCTCTYHSSSELCFNLWLHITTSFGLICRSHRSR